MTLGCGSVTSLPHPHGKQAAPERASTGPRMCGGPRGRHKRRRTARWGGKEGGPDPPARGPRRAHNGPDEGVQRPAGSDTRDAHPSASVMQPGAFLCSATIYGGQPKAPRSRKAQALSLPTAAYPESRIPTSEKAPYPHLGE